MATVQDLIDELDDHGFSDTSSARKVSIINDVANDINSRNPWKYLRASASLSIVSGNDTPSTPATMRQVIGITIPSISGILLPEDLRGIRKTYRGDTTAAQPTSYYFVGNTLKIYPVPDANYTATIDYVQNQATLTSSSVEADILLPARHHRCIVLGSLAKLYAMEDDTDLSPLFENQYESRILTMTEDLTAEQYDRPSRVLDVYQEYDWWA